MPRLPLVTRDAVPKAEQEAYDAFIAGRGGVPTSGPYAVLLHMPDLASRLEALRTYIRADDSLSRPLQELVMLTVARELDCAYIWYAHAPAARQAGLRDDIVDCLRDQEPLTGLDPDEHTVVDFTQELLQHRKVSDATFTAALTRFGQRGLMTLTNLIGCYALLAYNMNTYQVEAPAHPTEPPLPIAE
jgi:4-carboxymuconolactone decarboxylase